MILGSREDGAETKAVLDRKRGDGAGMKAGLRQKRNRRFYVEDCDNPL